jgi:hypothetical protein
MARQRRFEHCGSPAHALSRRAFLGGIAAGGLLGGIGSLHALAEPALARELRSRDRRVILLWLAGGSSQLETWDPKPGRPTGGPFAAIPTSVPGVHISELMPKLAARMHDLCVIRSLNTRNGDHGGASELMMRGRLDEPSLRYPDLGAVVARELGRADSQVPDYVSLYTATEGRGFSKLAPAFLGSRYAPIQLAESPVPPNIARPDSITEEDHRARAELRELLSRRFSAGRGSSAVSGHGTAYARVHGLMSSAKLFDVDDEPASARERYGPTLFGRQTLMARRMVEAGVPFVRVARAWWDSHGQNFETHQEMVPELDHVMSALIDDLKERGLFDHTLIIAMGEFGRTPKINASLGRDHFASAWSVALAGCGVRGGAVYGRTDANGERVADGEIGAGRLFATILEALGIPHDKEHHVGARPVPLVDPGIKPVRDVLV